MAVIGYDYFPNGLIKPPPPAVKASLWGGRAASPLDVGGYAFLHNTHNWKAEDLCLAYALTEPSLASVQIDAGDVDRLDGLAAVSERDLPPGLGAQIEMARFGDKTATGQARKA